MCNLICVYVYAYNNYVLYLRPHTVIIRNTTTRVPTLLLLRDKVLKGGNLDIGLYVTSPNGKKLLSLPRTTKRSLTFETSYGVYEFCLRYISGMCVGMYVYMC